MRLLLRIGVLPLAVAALATGVAAAATLTVASQAVSAGDARVGSCETGSLAFSRAVDNSGNVTSVTVGGISEACAGATLMLTVAGNPSGGSYSSLLERTATVPSPCAGGCSVTFGALGGPAALSVGAYSAVLLGP